MPQNYNCSQYGIIRRLEIYLKMALSQTKDIIPKLYNLALLAEYTFRAFSNKMELIQMNISAKIGATGLSMSILEEEEGAKLFTHRGTGTVHMLTRIWATDFVIQVFKVGQTQI
jgi:hypothetical protein